MHNVRNIFKSSLNALIVLSLALMISIIWTGGFELRLAGAEISFRNLLNPFLFMSFILLGRFSLAIGWKNSITFITTLFISAALVEVLLRVIATPMAMPILKNIQQPSETLGYSLTPFLKDKTIQTNSHGLRDRERSWTKPHGMRRVLGIGDSFTFGYSVNVKDSYLKQLEQRLNRNEEKWDVINAGVPGYSMWQYLAYFEHFGFRYQPDLITIGVFFDDFYGDPYAGNMKENKVSYRSFSSLRVINFSRNAKDLLFHRYRYLSNASWLRSVEDRRRYVSNTTKYHRLLTGKADQQVYKKFELRLKKMADLTARYGAPLLVLFIPDVSQINFPDFQVFNEILRDICRRSKVRYLDITPFFEEVEDIKKLYLLPNDAHTSAEGHRVIARELEEIVVQIMGSS